MTIIQWFEDVSLVREPDGEIQSFKKGDEISVKIGECQHHKDFIVDLIDTENEIAFLGVPCNLFE